MQIVESQINECPYPNYANKLVLPEEDHDLPSGSMNCLGNYFLE